MKTVGKSTKKTPITGITTADTEKQDKRHANRQHRRTNKQILNENLDDTKLKNINEISNLYAFDKDGKYYFGNEDDKAKTKIDEKIA